MARARDRKTHDQAATADRLQAAAEDARVAAAALGSGAGGDLGPAGLTAAVDELIGTWAGRIEGVHSELNQAGQELRRARDAGGWPDGD